MKFKRFIAVVSAVVMIGACSAVNVSATVPAGYDINGDGVVNISDAVAINMALTGEWNPSDLSDIDVNQNGVVDDLDRMSIMAYVMMIGTPTITMQ